MDTKYFPEVTKKIQFEGKGSKNPFAFRYYDANRVVGGKTMAEHLRFSVAYWHTMMGTGSDMFGSATYQRPWHSKPGKLDKAKDTLDAAFEFFTKLGVDYYCFHDRDISPEGDTFAESCKNLEIIGGLAKQKQADTGVKLLWGTANLFSNPIFTHGAGSNPDAHIFALAAAQVKHAMDITNELGGENYVFWGGREGYETLLNTDLKHEQDQIARFFHMAVDYKKSIGFEGQFLIEPKPAEPTKHQYDFDSATSLAFLQTYDLLDHFKLNIEANHATLAKHDFQHELMVASAAGKLGSVDANRGDMLLGWDTDQFPTNIYDAAHAMMIILKQNGLGSGGLNFDAKLRRGSIDTVDLFHGHIGGMDTFARGLLIAQKIIDEGALDGFVAERYQSYNQGIGEKIMKGGITLNDADAFIRAEGEPTLVSGRQEYLENVINDYLI